MSASPTFEEAVSKLKALGYQPEFRDGAVLLDGQALTREQVIYTAKLAGPKNPWLRLQHDP